MRILALFLCVQLVLGCQLPSRFLENVGEIGETRLQLVHPPRTGGETIIQGTLKPFCDSNEKCFLDLVNERETQPFHCKETETASMWLGRHYHKYCPELQSSNLFTVLTVRNPMHHIRSIRQWLHRSRSESGYIKKSSRYDFYKFLKYMTREEIKHFDTLQQRYVVGTTDDIDPVKLTELAMEKLAQIDVVIVDTDFEGSLQVMHYHAPHIVSRTQTRWHPLLKIAKDPHREPGFRDKEKRLMERLFPNALRYYEWAKKVSKKQKEEVRKCLS